jgi:DNA gyrase/topoisomerase IV subunit A
MDQNLPKLYKEYGSYSNYRNFPLDLDGLKPVERRVLLSAYKIARSKFAKCRQVDTYTCGHYHPHGECYGTIVQLVRQGFLTGQGNFGSNVGIESVGAAAPRYTECRINDYTLNLAFKMINSVPWVQTEMDDTEPFYLPTMFPICLMGKDYTQGIGFGYKTYIPCYEIKDLNKRLLWLLGKRKTKPTIKPITDCVILSSDKVVEELLTIGKAKIEVRGTIKEEPRLNKVTLNSWPPGKRFETILNKLSKHFESGEVGFTDLSVTDTQIVFQVLRERNRDAIYRRFVSDLKSALEGTISFEILTVTTDQIVKQKSVDQLLLDTYNIYCKTTKKTINDKIKQLNETVSEYQTLLQIRPLIAKGIEFKKSKEEILDEIIKKLPDVSKKVATELMNKYKIMKLLTVDIDTTDLNTQAKQLKENLKHLIEYVLEDYNGFVRSI